MFNIKNNIAPSYLSQHFKFVSYCYNSRTSSNSFVVPRPIGITTGNFNYNGTKLWNSLSFNVKSFEDRSSFKRKVKLLLRSDTL